MAEISTKPYLLRALYEWCVDSGYTPHLAVKVDSRTQVPSEYVRDGEITLNVGPTAVHKLQMGNEVIEFSARFGGVARQISVPIGNVYALYARETGHGMTFDVDPPKAAMQDGVEVEPEFAVPMRTSLAPVSEHASSKDDSPPPKPGGRPTLRRVK